MIRPFADAFFFMYEIREEFKQKAQRFGCRWISNQLNGQIDVTPINNWYFRQLPTALSSRRRLYLLMALETSAGVPAQVLVSIAYDLQSDELGIHAYRLVGSEREDLLADTTKISSLKTSQLLALKILRRLQDTLTERDSIISQLPHKKKS
jgi:hypothetical protein